MKPSRGQLATIIAQWSSSRRLSSAHVRAIAAYVLQSNRTAELAPLLRDVSRVWAQNGALEVTAVSAHPLSPKAVAEMRVRAKALYPHVKQIAVTTQLDPQLIGGVRAQIGDYELDLSVRTKLARFTAAALQGES